MESIENRIALIRNRIANACQAAGRSPSSIDLIAVSKTASAESIRAAHLCGQRRFGESYAEELVHKHERLKDLDIDWVFIGPLQTNKISKIMKCANEIQSVGSERHARYIDRYLEQKGIDQFPIYLQVNAGEEQQKSGMDTKRAIELSELLREKYPRLRVQGIMAIPPEEISKSATLETIPEMFYNLFDSARKVGAGKLSLGMSQDLEAAIQAGSTCVRVGSDIFKKSIL